MLLCAAVKSALGSLVRACNSTPLSFCWSTSTHPRVKCHYYQSCEGNRVSSFQQGTRKEVESFLSRASVESLHHLHTDNSPKACRSSALADKQHQDEELWCTRTLVKMTEVRSAYSICVCWHCCV